MIIDSFSDLKLLLADAMNASPVMENYDIYTKAGSAYSFRGCPIEIDTSFAESDFQVERSEQITLESTQMPPESDVDGAIVVDGERFYKVLEGSYRRNELDCQEVTLIEICDADKDEIKKRHGIDIAAPKRRRNRNIRAKHKNSGSRRQNRG